MTTTKKPQANSSVSTEQSPSANRFRFRAWFPAGKEMAGTENWLYIGQSGQVFDGSPCNCGLVPLKKDDCILMQSTGLTDKNGKEIFEGDIVRYVTNRKQGVTKHSHVTHVDYVIVWDDYRSRFIGKRVGGISEYKPVRDMGGDEIIGNLYQNPELLQ